jgi:hypothetical protein
MHLPMRPLRPAWRPTRGRTRVLRPTEMWGPGRSRRANFRARLPTNLPGISFVTRGRAWFRQDLSAYPALPLRAAKAATLAGVYEIAKAETERFEPEGAFHAEQAVSVSLADWRSLQDSPVKVRAILTLDLPAEDAAKAERFTESRRAARLDEALARDHMKFLREVALADEDTARLWWLHCNLAGDDPATSWDVFNTVVRPLIRIADENDPVTKLARALLTMNDYIHEDPGRLETLANIATVAIAKMGQGELARTLATLRQAAPSDQSRANGSAPAQDATAATAATPPPPQTT